MNKFKGSRLSTDLLESHHYICDLVHLEFSLVSLYSDGKRNWIYLWCDANSADRQRWLVFSISRKALVAYLEKESSLLDAVNNANRLLLLEERTGLSDSANQEFSKRKPRRYLWQVTPESVADYLPTANSLFDPHLAPDLDLNKQVEKLQFASPGDIQFEAIQSIGHSISLTTLLYMEHEAVIEGAHKNIKRILTSAKLNKVDLSGFSDRSIPLKENQWAVINQSCATICQALQIEEEMATLKEHSPNTVVYAKAVNSFVRQVMRLAVLQKDDMLNFASPGDV